MSELDALLERIAGVDECTVGVQEFHEIRRDAVRVLPDLAKRLAEAEQNLRNLLAVIHRDGGHHSVEHGLEKSTEMAMERYYSLVTDSESLAAITAERDALRLDRDRLVVVIQDCIDDSYRVLFMDQSPHCRYCGQVESKHNAVCRVNDWLVALAAPRTESTK